MEPAGSRRTVSVKGFSALGRDTAGVEAATRRAVAMGADLALTYEITFPVPQRPL